eukprot:CAMPEP_0174229352 /NCGR_PEP_ID=MMETSP0417-20130205/356_1 /TAXON_ID=242541 /ORGANISM="Mayorella sp, Strain BSH-02190019" /LENGTH=351 /DNA_ID=CAMNT_0015306891 /DNA_START=131 /DNA_END=1186 /DNA_ORIENTATION=+
MKTGTEFTEMLVEGLLRVQCARTGGCLAVGTARSEKGMTVQFTPKHVVHFTMSRKHAPKIAPTCTHIITIVRDPRDVAISAAFFFKKRGITETTLNLDTFVASLEQVQGQYNLYSVISRSRLPALFLDYEGIHTDPVPSMRELVNFLDISARSSTPLSDEDLRRLFDFNSVPVSGLFDDAHVLRGLSNFKNYGRKVRNGTQCQFFNRFGADLSGLEARHVRTLVDFRDKIAKAVPRDLFQRWFKDGHLEPHQWECAFIANPPLTFSDLSLGELVLLHPLFSAEKKEKVIQANLLEMGKDVCKNKLNATLIEKNPSHAAVCNPSQSVTDFFIGPADELQRLLSLIPLPREDD